MRPAWGGHGEASVRQSADDDVALDPAAGLEAEAIGLFGRAVRVGSVKQSRQGVMSEVINFSQRTRSIRKKPRPDPEN